MCMNEKGLARSHSQWKEIIWQSLERNRQDYFKYLTFIRQKKHSVPAGNINSYEKQTMLIYWGYTYCPVVCSKHRVIKCFSTRITTSLVQLSPVTCLETATCTSAHTGPDPKLNGRNESEDCFSPCQLHVPLTSHAKWHHKALVCPTSETLKCERSPGQRGVCASRGRYLSNCSVVLCPHRSCPGCGSSRCDANGCFFLHQDCPNYHSC